MTIEQSKPRRKSFRLQDYDYSKPGAYFVTICIKDKVCNFGKIVDEKMVLSKIGHKAKEFWLEIPHHFDHVRLDEFIVMPNHLHGNIFLEDDDSRGVQLNAPTKSNCYSKISPRKHTLSVIIRTYKAAVTRWCKSNGQDHFQWQRNYHDRIIRDEDELNRIREYIMYNPLKWKLDEENPENWT